MECVGGRNDISLGRVRCKGTFDGGSLFSRYGFTFRQVTGINGRIFYIKNLISET